MLTLPFKALSASYSCSADFAEANIQGQCPSPGIYSRLVLRVWKDL